MELLDEKEKKENNKRTFSFLSFIFGLFTLLMIGYTFFQMPSTVRANESLDVTQPSIYAINSMRISCILGLIMAFFSFRNKEAAGALKWMGAVLNVLCLLIIFGSIFFAILIKAKMLRN